MQISSSSSTTTHKMISLWGMIIVSLVFLNFALILHDFYSSFRFILSIFKSFLGIISYSRVTTTSSSTTTTTTENHRNLSISELKMVMEKADDIGGVFEEEEPSLMEVKEAFDVFDENEDGFIDAKELRKGLVSLGFMVEEEASEDECERMIKGFDYNFDGRIDFNEFVKVVESSFCSSN